MPFQIIKGDITKLSVDAIVNAANTGLQMGGGVCGAIFEAAGARELQAECDRIGGIKTGEAVITGGYHLPAGHVIHTAGPVWQGGGQGEKELLEACYRNSLELAARKGLSSVAFPIISSGIYGYPREQALEVATQTIGAFLAGYDPDMDVYLVVFDKSGFSANPALKADIDRFIAERSEPARALSCARFDEADDVSDIQLLEEAKPPSSMESKNYLRKLEFDSEEAKERGKRHKIESASLIEYNGAGLPSDGFQESSFAPAIAEPEPAFSERLRRLIIAKNLNDVEVYKRANLSRQHWSKIISHPDYQPTKRTVFALAVAMRLNIDETRDLLLAAGFALSPSHTFDLIIEYFINHRKYDIYEINEVLFRYEQPLLV